MNITITQHDEEAPNTHAFEVAVMQQQNPSQTTNDSEAHTVSLSLLPVQVFVPYEA